MNRFKNAKQTYLEDIVGSISDNHNKANTARSKSNKFFGFPVHVKVVSYHTIVY